MAAHEKSAFDPGHLGVAIRRRPDLYIGEISHQSAVHRLLFEVVGLGVSLHRSAGARRLRVAIEGDRASVDVQGPRVPAAALPGSELTPFELLTSTLGRAALGAPIASALSAHLEVEVRRRGRRYVQRFARGNPASALREVGRATTSGVRVTFTPDFDLLPRFPFNRERVAARLAQLAFLNPGLAVVLDAERLAYPAGLADRVRELRAGAPLHPTPLRLSGERSGVRVEVAFAWSATGSPALETFVDQEPVADAAIVDGFFAGLVRGFRRGSGGALRGVQSAAARELLERGSSAVIAIEPRAPGDLASAPVALRRVVGEGMCAFPAVVDAVLAARLPR